MTRRKSKIRALVIEDSAYNRQALVEMLESDSEIEVVGRAANGEEGLKEALIIKPDVVTLDLEMPKEWGPRFYRKMRKNDALKDIPVIVISGLSNPKHAIKDAVAVIRKPFDEENVLEIVKGAIG